MSVDLERGYDSNPERVAELARIGVAGVNLEDGGGEPEVLAAKLSACRARLAHLGLDLFLNARADVFLHSAIPAPERVTEVVRRGLCYRAAGADGLFVPALFELSQMDQIASAVPLPLNVWPCPITEYRQSFEFETNAMRLLSGDQPGVFIEPWPP